MPQRKTSTRYVVVRLDLDIPDDITESPEDIVREIPMFRLKYDYLPESRARVTAEIVSVSEERPGITVIDTGTPNTDRILGAALSGGDVLGLAKSMIEKGNTRKES